MRKIDIFICGLFLLVPSLLLADEPTRSVQEQLRNRNLYFGDVDGRMNAELRGALKRYQTRKNLEVTGEIDEETAKSLNVPVTAAKNGTTPIQRWPDVPVLKSDAARALPETERVVLEQKSDAEPAISPPAPAESPSALQNISPERVTKFVEDYLRDAETEDVDLQVRYYEFPVEYFDHGRVSRDFVARDTGNYVKRWPTRHYTLTEPVTFFATNKEDETRVEFTINFTVKNSKHTATGRTKNYWTIKAEDDRKLKIIAIRETRLHE